MSKVCIKCGALLEDNAIFCGECGTKQSNMQSLQQPFQQSTYGQVISGNLQANNIQLSVSQKKKRKLPIILSVIGGLFVLLIIIGVIVGNNESDNQLNQSSTGVNLSQTYTNEEEGFSFKYASGWVPVNEDEFADYIGKDEEYPLVLLANKTEGLPEENTYIMISRFDVAQDDIDYLFIDDEQFASTFDDDVTIEDTFITEIDGVAARKIIYTDEDGIGWQSYFYAVAPVLYRIDFVYYGKSAGNYQRFFDAIMDSYTIMESDSVAMNAELSYDSQSASAADDRKEGVYYIGDTVPMSLTNSSGEIGCYDITMTNWGTYKPEYIDDTYVYVTFEIVNTGNADIFISEFSFSAYVNNYNVDIGWPSEDNSLSATLSSGRRTSGNVYIRMNPEDVNQLELELGDIIFILQDNSLTEEIPFGYEGEESYTDYIEWGGVYADGWMDTSLTFSLYSDGSQDPECGYMTTNFRGMESTGELYYLGGNQFRWESGGYESIEPEIYYVYAVYKDQEYQLDLYNDDGEYEVTFTLYEQYIP